MKAILLIINCLSITLHADTEWTDTSWDQYPYMARVVPSVAAGLGFCGGSIIATDEYNGKGVILTAAHCVDGAANIVVSIGCTRSDCTNDGVKEYNDDYYIVHPSYDGSLAIDDDNWKNHDVALIFLEEAITNEGARKVSLYPNMNVLKQLSALRALGYGGVCPDPTKKCNGGSDTDMLEYADTNYLGPNVCAQFYHSSPERVNTVHDFCVYDVDQKQALCGGDSGSPIMYQHMQIGIVSWSSNNCDVRLPQIATSVPHYYEWIAGQCPECIVNHYVNCGVNCLIDYDGCDNKVPCHQVIGAKYEVNSRCYIALTGSFGALKDPDRFPAALQQTDCYPHYDYPSCKPDCMINYGGCDNDIPCHEVVGRMYEIEGECWTALSMGCRGCLDSPLSNPSGVTRTSCRAFRYPDCSPYCFTNRGDPNAFPLYQIIGRIYEVNGLCYRALTDCDGCLLSLLFGLHHTEALEEVICGASQYPECKPDCLTDYGGCEDDIPCHQTKQKVYQVKGVCYLALTHCSGCLKDPAKYPEALQVVSCSHYPQTYEGAQSFLGHSLSNKLPFEGGDGFNNYYGLSGFQILFVLLFMLVFTVINFVICCCNKQGEYKTIAIKESDDDV